MTFLLLVFGIILSSINAYPDHGFTGMLSSLHNVPAEEWYKVQTWQASPFQEGQYLENMEFNDDRSSITVVLKGLYYVTFNIKVESPLTYYLKVAVVVNDDIQALALQSDSQITNNESISASGIIKGYTGDSVSIYLHSTANITIAKDSSWSIRFHEAFSALPGFMFGLSESQTVESGKHSIIGDWEEKCPSHFTSSSSFRQKLSHFQIPEDGVYLLALNLVGFINYINKVTVEVLKNGNSTIVVSSFQHPRFTISFTDLIELSATDIIQFKVSSHSTKFEIYNTSTASMVLVKLNSMDTNGFRAEILNAYDTSQISEHIKLRHWKVPENSSISFDFLRDSTLVDDSSFSTEQVDAYGVYYVVANIIITATFGKDTTLTNKYIDVSYLGIGTKTFQTKRLFLIPDGVNEYEFDWSYDFVVNLNTVVKLSKSSPISVTMSQKDSKNLRLRLRSSFAVIQTANLYPGCHGAIMSPKPKQNIELITVDGLTTTGKDGLYDFTNSMNKSSGEYTAIIEGVYLVTTNIVFKDIDMPRATALISKDDSERITSGFYAEDSNPLANTALNTGGFMHLSIGSKVSLKVQTGEDQDWKLLKNGLSIMYVSPNPVYIQTMLESAQTVPTNSEKRQFQIKPWKSMYGSIVLEDGAMTLQYTGVYYTIGSIILKNAAKASSSSYYKAQLKLDGAVIKGIYSNKKIGVNANIDPMYKDYTLFFSGSFYAEKGMKLLIEIETGADVSYRIAQGSSWGLLFVSDSDRLSGGLSVIGKDQTFRESGPTWRLIKFPFLNSRIQGLYVKTTKLSFESEKINIQNSGIYLISLNLEVEYNNPEKVTFKVSVIVNEHEDDINGMTVWKTSSWASETIHVSSAIFLNGGDRIEVKLSSGNIDNMKVLSTSGYSIVKIIESSQSASLTVVLKDELVVTSDEIALKNFQFFNNLRSTSMNLEEGIIRIPYSGIYLLDAFVEVNNSDAADGVLVNLKVNGMTKETFKKHIKNGSGVIIIQKVLALNLGDQVQLTIQSLFNEDVLQEKYKDYIYHLNTTAPENVTMTNPYHNLNLSVLTDATSMSFQYFPNFALMQIKKWWGKLLQTVNFTDINSQELVSPWFFETNINGGEDGKILIEKSGIYFMMATLHLEGIKDVIEVSFKVSDNKKCIGRVACVTECNDVVVFACASRLTSGDNIALYIQLNKQHISVTHDSIRTINYMNTTIPGFSMTSKSYNPIEFNGDWMELGNWGLSDDMDELFYEGISFYQNELIFHAGGYYQIAINLILQVDERPSDCDECSIPINIAIYNNQKSQKNLLKKIFISFNSKIATLNLLGNIEIMKWDRIILKLNAPSGLKVSLMKGTKYAIFYAEPEAFSRVIDEGPLMTSVLEPSSHSTEVMGIVKEWECYAFADGKVTYRWFKNGELYQVDNNTNSFLRIRGYINDTGEYICEAEYKGIKVSSNPVKVDIYDVDECKSNKHKCSKYATCTNTPGYYDCKCLPGYTGDGFNCSDTSECSSDPCGLNTVCKDKGGVSYSCECLNGYRGNAYENCTDFNECHIDHGNHTCDEEKAYCINLPGTYNCSCKYGWSGNFSNGFNCTDLNECEVGNNTCHENAICINTNGSYICKCIEGYTGDGSTCTDIDECSKPYEIWKRNDSICVQYSECVNQVGNYTCKCAEGFIGDGTVHCEDIDECKKKPCNAQADCINTNGSYYCQCRTGWSGDGFQCADTDECETGQNECGKNGNCTNSIGDYSCICDLTYRLNGKTCEVDPAQVAAITDECILDADSFACLCRDPEKREDNIMCNGLFVALLILIVVALVVVLLLYKYLKSRKLMKIKPVKHHRDKYIEMVDESDI